MYELKYTDIDGTVKIAQFSHHSCSDIVREFYYFLLGVSFHKNTIANSFSEILEEYEDKVTQRSYDEEATTN